MTIQTLSTNQERSDSSVALEYFTGHGASGEGDRFVDAGSGLAGSTFPSKVRSPFLFSEYSLGAPAVVQGVTGDMEIMQTLAASSLATQNDMADYLTTGFWAFVGETPPRFNLGTTGYSPNDGELLYNVSGYYGDPDGLTEARANLVREAFKVFGEVLGITFTETTSTGDEVDFFFGDNGAGAYSGGVNDPTSGFIDYAYINIAASWSGGTSTNNDYTLQTIFHEIGHALGLGHPGPYNGSAIYGVDNIFDNDSWQVSVMSYFSQSENTSIVGSDRFLQGPMVVDWIALDNL